MQEVGRRSLLSREMDTDPPPQNIAGRLKQPLLMRRQSTKTAVDCALECGSGKLDPSRGTPGNDEFSVSNGLWEAADDGTRSATEGRFGIKFLQHHSSQHPDKLLEYETEQLERHPFSIILDETRLGLGLGLANPNPNPNLTLQL